ncbi:Mis6-domain-containing protein [Periconia macrospinosa]|uniref:Mis6-domain-containing protein n=1 Tax=Periconia macrospinosa TaxID=97972 RepID=A0A2V1DKZ1_9PLEO|nr:Mis6-domain-containing protein [Periconia macrospinosa]
MPSVADPGQRPEALHDALKSLDRASQTPAKQRSVKVSGIVDVVCNHAFDHGLDEDALRRVTRIISKKSELDQTSITNLIKNLYPAQRVSADVVITMVGALGQGRGKPTPGTQNNLVRWLATVHEILEDPAVLSRLYGVLFGMLDMISIRTPLCHLLSLITRRKHVKPFRIQYLLEFSRSLGNEPALQGLLRIYKDYYPDIILGSTSTSRNSFAPQPDSEWRARLLSIQDRDAGAASSINVHNGFRVLRKAPKRVKSRLIPDVHTFYTNEASVTLEGIDSVDDFVEKLDRIDPPGQLISFLTDPLLQKYVELKPSPILERRIELWLSTCLEEHYNATKEGMVDSSALSEVLDGLLKHAQYTKKLLPIVETFLKEYLLIWDGVSDMDSILGLVSYIPIQPFQDAYTTFLQPIEQALTSRHDALLPFYTSLLRQWINHTSPQPTTHPIPALTGASQTALSSLVTHVSYLSTSLLLTYPLGAETPTASSILTFYEHLAASSTPYRIPILLPPTPLTSLLLLTPSPTTLSRTAGLIASYKTAFNKHPTPVRDFYPTPFIDTFNVLIRDMYNLLWISRALSTAKDDTTGRDKAIGLHCHPTLREALNDHLSAIVDDDDHPHDYAVHTAFGISHNAHLASLAAFVWKGIEEGEVVKGGYEREGVEWHVGPVSQRSLELLKRNGGVEVEWERYRVEVLRWLEARGLEGVKEFLWASSESLKRKYGE